MNLPRSAGVQLHPTSLPGGRLGRDAYALRRLARRRRAVVVADAAARAARPARLAVQVARRRSPPGRACSPSRDAPVTEAEELRLPRARGGLDRATGRASPARRGRRPGALRARVGARCARYAAERGVRLIGDVPIYVAPGQRRPPRAPRALPRRRGRRRAAGRLHRQGPAVGQPALRLAGAAAARLPLVDRAPAAHVRALSTSRGSTTSAASSPTGRCRAGARDALVRALAARPGPRAVRRRGARRSARAAADRRGPRRHHAGRSSGCATRSGCPGMVVLQFGFDPATRAARTGRANHAERQRRLHRHARPRHGARLVRARSSAACAPRSTPTIAAPASRERRAVLVADPARLRLAGARGDGPGAGRARASAREARMNMPGHRDGRVAVAPRPRCRRAARGAPLRAATEAAGRRPRLSAPMAAPRRARRDPRRQPPLPRRRGARLRRQVGHRVRRGRPPPGARQGRASCSARAPGRSSARWRSARAPATSR